MTVPVILPNQLPDSVDALEAVIAALPADQHIEIPTVHHFADGVYAREITIPKGTILTGKIHKTRHLNIISAGRILVYNAGEPTRELVAPCSFVALPGTRRVGLALEDTVWTTVHGTEETDLDQLEAALIEPNTGRLNAGISV